MPRSEGKPRKTKEKEKAGKVEKKSVGKRDSEEIEFLSENYGKDFPMAVADVRGVDFEMTKKLAGRGVLTTSDLKKVPKLEKLLKDRGGMRPGVRTRDEIAFLSGKFPEKFPLALADMKLTDYLETVSLAKAGLLSVKDFERFTALVLKEDVANNFAVIAGFTSALPWKDWSNVHTTLEEGKIPSSEVGEEGGLLAAAVELLGEGKTSQEEIKAVKDWGEFATRPKHARKSAPRVDKKTGEVVVTYDGLEKPADTALKVMLLSARRKGDFSVGIGDVMGEFMGMTGEKTEVPEAFVLKKTEKGLSYKMTFKEVGEVDIDFNMSVVKTPRGWETRYSSADVPAEALERTVREIYVADYGALTPFQFKMSSGGSDMGLLGDV